MLSSIEAWWGGLYALPFDGAKGAPHFFEHFHPFCHMMDFYSLSFREGWGEVHTLDGATPNVFLKA